MARIASRDLAYSLSFDDEGPKDCVTGCTNKTSNKASVAGEADLAQLHTQLAGIR